MRFRGFLGRIFFLVAYPLYYRRKLRKEDRLGMFGFHLTVPPGVFHPQLFFSTKILGSYLASRPLSGLTVLEMGCGSGLLSLVAARGGGSVTGVDVNPLAVEATKRNVESNGMQKQIRVKQSDLFDALPSSDRFDLIFWNPPYYPHDPVDDAAKAMDGGKGYDVLARFARKAGRYLNPGGSILLILTGRASDEERIIRLFTDEGMSATVACQQQSFFEQFRIHELTK